MGVAVEKILGQLIVLGWLSFHFLARFAMITFISNILLMFFREEEERLKCECTDASSSLKSSMLLSWRTGPWRDAKRKLII